MNRGEIKYKGREEGPILQIRVAVSFPLSLISHLAKTALVLPRLRARASAPRLPGEIGGNIYLVL